MAQGVTGLSPRRPGFVPGSVSAVFVVDEVTLGQVSLRVVRFFSRLLFTLALHSHVSYGG
jgi:hypothetical protein